MFTSKIGFALLGLFCVNLSAAYRTASRCFLDDFFGVLTFRISRAGKELSKASHLDNHVSAAVFADHIGHFVRNFQLHAFHLFLCFGEVLFKLGVEGRKGLYPVCSSFLYLIQIGLHLCGKVHVYNRAELFFHQLGSHLSQLGRNQALGFTLYIAALDNRCDGRRIGTWTADTVFFQCLDNRSLGIACRRLGEMLVFLQIVEV